MVTNEQLRGADHEGLVCFIADLGTILDDLLSQNSELLALVRAWQAMWRCFRLAIRTRNRTHCTKH
jgi:hypothetical protein